MKTRYLLCCLTAFAASALLISFGSSVSYAVQDDYSWAKELIQNNVSTYDESNNTIVLLDHTITWSDYEKNQNLNLDDVNNINIGYDLFVNDTEIETYDYYYLNKDSQTIIKSTSRSLSDKLGSITAIILNKNVTFNLIPDRTDWYYPRSGYMELDYSLLPSSKAAINGISGVASEEIYPVDLGYEVFDSLYNNVEIWTVNPEHKKIDNPGEFGYRSYLKLKLELRDKDGNISLFKNGWYNNYSNRNNVTQINDDGIIYIPITPWGREDDDSSYGEFDIYLPRGYDFRLTPVDYGEELGQFAHVYDDYLKHDDQGFALAINQDDDSIFQEYTFLPRGQKVTIKNIKESKDENDGKYYYRLFQSVVQNTEGYIKEERKYYGVPLPDYIIPLSNFSYRLYSELTGEEIETGIIHKTDENGLLMLSKNQYAVFDVYHFPDDINQYDCWGINIIQNLNYGIGIDIPRKYYSQALDYEQYTQIYNGSTTFDDDLASALPGETIIYVIKDSNEEVDPVVSDDTVNPATLDGIFAPIIIFIVMAVIGVSFVYWAKRALR